MLNVCQVSQENGSLGMVHGDIQGLSHGHDRFVTSWPTQLMGSHFS